MVFLNRICLLTFFVIGLVFGSGAQTVTTPDLNKSLISPSPEAASLGKFGIIPVSLYTGMPNVTVPVYELKSAKLSVPISLNYNYNGYRPGEEASWAGLGWTVQAGGVITRVVKGMVDESTLYPDHWQQYADILDMTNNMDFMGQVGNRQVDTEPDVYIFNFNGHSGKFILVGNRAFLFPKQDLQITQTSAGFTIVAEDGISYFFQDQELSTPSNNQNPGSYMPAYISAWYLTKMVSSDNTDEVDFQYTNWAHRQNNSNYQESYQQQTGGFKNNSECLGINSTCDTWSVNPYVGAMIAAKRLTGITCRGGQVNFIPESTIRQDLNSTTAFALQEIDILTPNSTLIKKMALVHGYFNLALKLSSITLTGYYVNTNLGGTGVDSIVIPNYYAFQYNNEGGYYPKGTRGIDKWGYYNGMDNNASLFDNSIVSYTPIMPVGDRTVYPTATANGVISRVTYPTGGYTNFTYENNLIGSPGVHQQVQNKQAYQNVVYLASGGNPNIANGLFQINQRQVINMSDGRDISNSPNGVLNNILILNIYSVDTITDLGTLIYTSHRLNKASSFQSDTLTLNPGSYSFTVSCESTSLSAYASISYYSVLNIPYSGDPGPGMRIKTIQSFDNISPVAALTKSYTYGPGTLLTANGYGFNSVLHHYVATGCGYAGAYTENIISSDYSSALATLINDQFYYPSVTEVNYDSAGSGKTVYEYHADGTDALGVWLFRQTEYAMRNGVTYPIRQKVNTYATTNLINFWAFTHNVSETNDPGGCLILPLNTPNNILDTIIRTTLYSASSYALSSNVNYLTATDEFNYDQNGQNPMTVHTDYYYDNPNYLMPTRTVAQDSKGYPITTLVKYPLDYQYIGCGSLYTIDTTFKSARDNSSISYQLCAQGRYNAAFPYWNPAIQNLSNTALLNALRSYSPQCENTYQNAYSAAVLTMNNSIPSYYNCLLYIFPDSINAIVMMQHNNVKSTPVEQIVSINKSGTDYLFGATKTGFTVNSANGTAPKVLYQTPFVSTSTLKSDFMANPTNYYQSRVNFKYDPLDNITEQSKTNDMKMDYIWDYNKMYVIAQVSNGDSANIAYTSFEADGQGNWVFPSAGVTGAVSGITGSKSYSLTGNSISKSGLDPTKSYVLSFWLKSGGSASVSGLSAPTALFSKNGWTYYESTGTGTSSVTINGSGNLDELRLFPTNAQMTTYSYDPLVGMTSSCSGTNIITYYFYDPLSRLKFIKDADGNIVKTMEYHYAIQ